MRLTHLVLALLFVGLLFACGGGDESTDGTAKKPKEPDKPKVPEKVWPERSAEAKELQRAYMDLRRIRSTKKRREAATEKAAGCDLETIPHDVKYVLGLIWQLGGDMDKAAEALTGYIENCSEYVNYANGLAVMVQVQLERDNPEEAIKYLDMLVRDFPERLTDHAKLQASVGRVLMAKGRFDESATYFGMAAANDYGYGAQGHLEALWAAGKYEEAREKARDYAEKFTGSASEKRTGELVELAAKLGETAPALDVEGWSEGKDFSFADAQGEVTLIYFWNISKANAEGMDKKLQELYEKYRERGLNIAGLSKHVQYGVRDRIKHADYTTADELEQLAIWADPGNFGTPWSLGLCADERNHLAYGYRSPPTYAVIGKKGVYRFYFCDLAWDTYNILGHVIDKLLAE